MKGREKLLSAIVSQGSLSFLTTKWNVESNDLVKLCVDVAAALEAAPLTDSEKSRRYSLFLSRAQMNRAQLTALAQAWSVTSIALRNTLASALPPEVRPLLFGKPETRLLLAKTEEGRVTQPQTVSGPSNWRGTFAGVLLLATDEQSANLDLLRREQLAPIRLRSVEEFEAHAQSDSDICGCIVDSSFTKYLSKPEQAKLFDKIAELSSFISIRVHDIGLQVSHAEIREIFRNRQANPRGPEFGQLTFRDDSHFKAAEVAYFHSAQRMLQAHSRGIFVPGELEDIELCTLMAAVHRYAASKMLGSEFSLSSLRTKFIPGGRTSARIASIQINREGIPLIVKIDKKEFILDEGRRFFTFISDVDTRLQPSVQIHGTAGVIIFGLVDEQKEALLPAPTLESILQELWWSETYKYKKTKSGLETDLAVGIVHASEKLAALNRKSANDQGFEDVAGPFMDPFKDAESGGRTWGISPDKLRQRDKAEAIFARLNGRAIVHGDVHLRNILVRGYREAYIIDYARSGPGHPAADLVRLELSLFMNAFRPFWQDFGAISFQEKINDPSTTAESLMREFPDVSKWKINRVCIVGMTAARDRALQLVKHYGGTTEDYLAAKLLFAWQGLLFKDLQAGLCGAAIQAISFV
jgi:phosphotransferase family enzyme